MCALCLVVAAAIAARPAESPPADRLAVMLTPGFRVRELPVALTNLVQVSYADDGRLFALGYDGRIHILTDRDGDGLEEAVTAYWTGQPLLAPIGMALAPEGLYVSTKGKIVLLRDTDADGKADTEEVVTSGWKPPVGPAGGLDAYGLTRDPGGSVYFSLGTSAFQDPYMTGGKSGKGAYDVRGERGTVIKVLPGGGHEIIATGIRFAVALAFNRHGDLFATDQEGATWLPDGNPLDELLHIVPGRHYGFPPRHPTHLPDVVDEPSVVNFGPQHQSTCGLDFNEATPARRSFGPPSWEGDAIVAGYSRGKIWRVPLIKRSQGYIGKPIQIASLDRLTIDTAVSPKGDMVVALHGGMPDWGTGPRGEGQLLKISYEDRRAPQPLAVWASGPAQVAIAFDRPVARAVSGEMVGKTIAYGPYVGAADRFEKMWPGYRVVRQQKIAPRRALKILDARTADGGRTLLLETEPQSDAVSYALTIPRVAESARADASSAVDLKYDLGGVEAVWRPGRTARPAESSVKVWLPHLDPVVNQRLLAGSAPHAAFARRLRGPGRLTLRTQLRLPAFGQVAATRAVVTIEARDSFDARLGDLAMPSRPVASRAGSQRAVLDVALASGPVPLEIVLRHRGQGPPPLDVSFHTDSDPHERPLNLDQLLVPWAKPPAPEPPAPVVAAGAFTAGNWERGRALFYGEARCSTCHSIRGQGGQVGPDLGNLVYADPGQVRRDIVEPNAAINPDYVSYAVAVDSGRLLTGLVRSEGDDRIRVTLPDGTSEILARSAVLEITPDQSSLMPTGFDGLGEDKLGDVITFLTSAAPSRHGSLLDERRAGSPPARTRQEVHAALAAEPGRPGGRALGVVLVSGKKDHGSGEHDYPEWRRAWSVLLQGAAGVSVDVADEWPSAAQLQSADVLVFFSSNARWSEDKGPLLDAFLARGGGVLFIHYALNGQQAPLALASRLGLAWRGDGSSYRHGLLDLSIVKPDHPIVRGLPKLRLTDETYWNLEGDPRQIETLAEAHELGEPRPILWVREPGRGRIFCSVLGHYSWTFNDPMFRLILLRGVAWVAREPVGRFNDLVTVGIDLRD